MSEHPNALGTFQGLLRTETVASLGPNPRPTREPIDSLEEKLQITFSATRTRESSQPPIRSLILLWHDYLDESHSISQNLHGADGSFLHGIMHRREPDYGNAKYWFHKVGAHPCYPAIATKAVELLDRANAGGLKSKLIPNGKWDAVAFVDACEKALRDEDEAAVTLLKRIQAVEFNVLLENLLR